MAHNIPPILFPPSDTTPTSEPLTVSPKEAQRLLGCSPTTFYALLREGRLDTFRVRSKRYVKYESLKRFAAGDAAGGVA